jgi:hypothetical protein
VSAAAGPSVKKKASLQPPSIALPFKGQNQKETPLSIHRLSGERLRGVCLFD